MQLEQLSSQLISLLGGKPNIASLTNCMTRLRLQLHSLDSVDTQAIKNLPQVIAVVEDQNYQVILGPGLAQKVAQAMQLQLSSSSTSTQSQPIGSWQHNKAALSAQQKQSWLKKMLKTIGSIFFPLIPAIIAAGLFNGIASLLNQQLVATNPSPAAALLALISFLQLLGGAFLSYFAIFTGINAAKEFGATHALGGVIGAVSISPLVNTLATHFNHILPFEVYNSTTPLNSIVLAGKGGILGVILGVYLLAVIEKALRKIIPNVLDLILTAPLALLGTGILMLFVVMPIAGVLSDGLLWLLSQLMNSPHPIISIISGYVLAALFLPMVLMGLHHGLIPLYAVQLEHTGVVSLFPILAMAGAGQIGASLAILVKAKAVNNLPLQRVILGALPAGFLGVGEPLIYGVTLPLGKSFITAGLGAGFGGAWVAMHQVSATSWGPSGLVALALMSSPQAMTHYLSGLVIAYIGGFIITWFALTKEAVLAV